MNSPRVSAIAALGKNRVLGKGNDLLWKIPADLKRFRELTEHHPLILGRKTFDSIVAIRGAALPNRTNIVVTHDAKWSYPGALRAGSIEEALTLARAHPTDEIFIGGGEQIYTAALPYTDRLYLTLVEDEKEGDVFFPPYEDIFTRVIHEQAGTHEALSYRFITLERP